MLVISGAVCAPPLLQCHSSNTETQGTEGCSCHAREPQQWQPEQVGRAQEAQQAKSLSSPRLCSITPKIKPKFSGNAQLGQVIAFSKGSWRPKQLIL